MITGNFAYFHIHIVFCVGRAYETTLSSFFGMVWLYPYNPYIPKKKKGFITNLPSIYFFVYFHNLVTAMQGTSSPSFSGFCAFKNS